MRADPPTPSRLSAVPPARLPGAKRPGGGDSSPYAGARVRDRQVPVARGSHRAPRVPLRPARAVTEAWERGGPELPKTVLHKYRAPRSVPPEPRAQRTVAGFLHKRRHDLATRCHLARWRCGTNEPPWWYSHGNSWNLSTSIRLLMVVGHEIRTSVRQHFLNHL